MAYPYFIPTNLDKYQTCTARDCGRDACVEYCVSVKGDVQLFIASCTSHDESMQQVVRKIAGGTSLKDLSRKGIIELENVFVCPATYQTKCRLTQWGEYLEKNTDGIMSTAQRSSNRIVTAAKGWSWPLNRDRWRTTEGELVSLGKLRLAELSSAVLQIVEVNYERIPRNLNWTKKITLPELFYVYPVEELEVGTTPAREKLEDLETEARIRALV